MEARSAGTLQNRPGGSASFPLGGRGFTGAGGQTQTGGEVRMSDKDFGVWHSFSSKHRPSP